MQAQTPGRAPSICGSVSGSEADINYHERQQVPLLPGAIEAEAETSGPASSICGSVSCSEADINRHVRQHVGDFFQAEDWRFGVTARMKTFGPMSPKATASLEALEARGPTLPHLRWQASRAMGALAEDDDKEEAAIALTRTLLHKDTAPYLRWQASQSIAQIGSTAGTRTASSLGQVLLMKKPGQPGAEAYVRCSVAEALGQLGDCAASDGSFALAEALRGERSELVRRRVAESLGQLGQDACQYGIQALLDAARHDEDKSVRVNACEAIGKIGPKAGEPAAVALAIVLARDKDCTVRLRAAATLGLLEGYAGEAGIAALLKAMRKDERLCVRDQALEAVQRLRASCVQTLSDVSGALDEYVRGRSAQILGHLGEMVGEDALEVLAVNLICDQDVYLRRRVAEAFDRLGPAAADLGIAALSKAASDDDDVYVQWKASEALAAAGGGALSQAAVDRLEHLVELDGRRRRPKPEPEAQEDVTLREPLDQASAATLQAQEDVTLREPFDQARAATLQAQEDVTLREPFDQVEKLGEQPQEGQGLRSAQEPVAEQTVPASLCGSSPTSGEVDCARARSEKVHYARASSEVEKLGEQPQEGQGLRSAQEVEQPAPEQTAPAAEAVRELPAIAESGPQSVPEAVRELPARTAEARPRPAQEEVEQPAAEQAAPAGAESGPQSVPEEVEQPAPEQTAPASAESGPQSVPEVVVPEAGALRGLPLQASAEEVAEQSPGGDLGSTDGGLALTSEAFGRTKSGRPRRERRGSLGKTLGTAFGSRRCLQFFEGKQDLGAVPTDVPFLEKALRQSGHQAVDVGMIQDIVESEFKARSFMDKDDFLKFVNLYGTRQWELLQDHFNEADSDSSGKLGIEEVEAVLRRTGVTPMAGVVQQLIAEVSGSAEPVVDFDGYVKIHAILYDRAGFTKAQYDKLQGIFLQKARSLNDTISEVQLRTCLQRQGFLMQPAEVTELVIEAVGLGDEEAKEESDSSDGETCYMHHPRPKRDPANIFITDDQYFLISRTLREREARRVMRAFKECDDDHNNTIDVDELPDLLLDLEYRPPIPEVVQEYVAECGLRGKSEFTFKDLCPVLEKLRENEGFSRAELEDLDQCFRQSDRDRNVALAGVELEQAIRSLGYPVTFEQVQEILDEFDLDESSEIDEFEFRHVMAMFRKAEMNMVVRRSMSTSSQVCRSDLPQILKDLGYALRQESDVLKGLGHDAAEQVNVWALARLVADYRREQREEMRKWRGYTEVQVQSLREQYRAHDKDGSGEITGQELRALLAELVPAARRNQDAHTRVRELLQASDVDGSGSISFEEFLEMMRGVRDYASLEKLKKERRAVEQTKFSMREIKEFRQVFRMFDSDQSVDMGLDELQQMLGVIVGGAATGHKGTKELKELFASFDEDGGNTLDFPEFLQIMRNLVDRNWCGLNDKSEKMAA